MRLALLLLFSAPAAAEDANRVGFGVNAPDAAFVSFTTGISTGIETGTQTTTAEFEMPSAVGVNDNTFELEGILRFGFLVGH